MKGVQIEKQNKLKPAVVWVHDPISGFISWQRPWPALTPGRRRGWWWPWWWPWLWPCLWSSWEWWWPAQRLQFFANFSRAEKLRCYFGIPDWYQSDREVLSENRQTLSCQVLTAQKLQLPVYLAFLASPEDLVIIVVKYTQAGHFVKFGAMLSIYILIYYIYLLTCNKGKSLWFSLQCTEQNQAIFLHELH